MDRPETRTLTVTYHGAPSSGLVFNAEREQIYTVFSTSQWMLALDEPSARATLRLRLTMPRAWTAAAAAATSLDATRVSETRPSWSGEQNRPVPTYTFGFAVGAFAEVDRSRRQVRRCVISDGGIHGSDLRRVFGESARMIAFFEERSGVPYPGETYAQALVARTAVRRWPGSPSSQRSTAARSWPIPPRSASSLTSSRISGGATWSPAMRGPSSG